MALKRQVISSVKKYRDVIVEEYIDGMEVTVPVVEIGKKVIPMAVIEVEKKVEILSYEIKSRYGANGRGPIRYYLPARIDRQLYKSILNCAKKAHECIGCRGYSRVDIIISPGVKINIIEINSLPTLIRGGFFAMAARQMGFSFEMVVEEILKTAMR